MNRSEPPKPADASARRQFPPPATPDSFRIRPRGSYSPPRSNGIRSFRSCAGPGISRKLTGMTKGSWMTLAGLAWLGSVSMLQAQIDPVHRELIQLGYNQPLEGRGPLAAYGFYYHNQPQWLQHSNLTLRLAVAPVYLDSELGVDHALGPNTDMGFGIAGGGFADSYSEVHRGRYEREESFLGHGGEISTSIYHLFNPASRIPLHAVLRGATHFSAYAEDSETPDNFELPDDQVTFKVRSGLRWGGREPVMMPDVAMEVSAWYEGDFRLSPSRYGFGNDRELNGDAHLFWGRGLLTYTLPEWRHGFGVSVTGGGGLNMDRLSSYRLGGNLPLYSEFPLTLPGYYFQELSARSFVLFGATYSIPLDSRQRWQVSAAAASACVDYLPGMEQPGHWNSGFGGGLVYRSPSDSWQVAVAYGYGVNAIRSDGRGAQSLTFLLQFDLDRTKRRFFDPSAGLGQSRGLQQIFRNIFR